MPNKNKFQKRTKNKNMVVGPRNPCPLDPGMYTANVTVTKTFRFISTGAGTFIITAAKLGALVSMCTTVTTTVTQIFEQVRLHYVRVWGTAGSPTASSQISLQYNGSSAGSVGNDRVYSDCTVGTSRVARIHCPPPIDCDASHWQSTATNAGTAPLFTMFIPSSGCVIDVHLSLRMTPDSRATNNTVPVTTPAPVLTQLYYLALDNPAGGTGATTNVLQPDNTLITTG